VTRNLSTTHAANSSRPRTTTIAGPVGRSR
jgi:hypothetical protein